MNKKFSYSINIKEITKIFFGEDCNNLSSFLIKQLNVNPSKCLLISDTNVPKSLLSGIENNLKTNGFKTYIFKYNRKFLSDEQIKSLSSASWIYNNLLNYSFDRADLIIAIGGGVIGDLSGFCAATYHRGLTLIHYPTSLLAQVDSSIGGKNGLHYKNVTNLIGTYYQSKGIYIDFSSLKTLPIDEFFNGLAEIIKIALIYDSNLANYLGKNEGKIKKKFPTILRKIIYDSIKLKSQIISSDVKENGARLLLNYGHTVGQAIETIFKHKNIKHGEAVVLGMIVATQIGSLLNITKPDFVSFQNKLLDKFDYLKRLRNKIDLSNSDIENLIDQICSNIFFDKKKRHDKLRFVIPENIGQGRIEEIKKMYIIRTAIQNGLDLLKN